MEKIEKKEAGAAGEPIYGGIIPVYQTSFDPPSLDPLSESPFQFLVPVVGIYNNLLREDPDGSGKVIGDLAKDWKTSGDGLVTTFFLREGVKFHDGTPFTAADVKASLDKIIDPDFRSPRGGGLLKPLIESVTVEDELTVVVTSKFPTPLLIPSLASDWVKILKADIVNDPKRDTADPALVIGTGPFIFKEWDRGSGVTWEKNPDYFEDGFPYLDGMEMFFMSDLATVMSSFVTKRVLVWGNIPLASPENIQDIENQIGNENFGIKELGIATITLFLNTQKPPFDDPKIRSAVWLVLDREQMDIRANGRLIEGHVSGHALNPSMSPAFALPIEEVAKIPGIPKPTDEDIARAKELMAEAGKPDGFGDIQEFPSSRLRDKLHDGLQGLCQRPDADSNLRYGEAPEYQVQRRSGERANRPAFGQGRRGRFRGVDLRHGRDHRRRGQRFGPIVDQGWRPQLLQVERPRVRADIRGAEARARSG